MHTNTTGGPTERPVRHRGPEDAANQSTTEPSSVERAAAALYFEERGVAPDDMVRRSQEFDTSFRAPAQVLADAGLLAPALSLPR